MTNPASLALASIGALGLMIGACAAEAPAAAQGTSTAIERELAEVRRVELKVLPGNPQRLSVTVDGVAPMPGFTGIRLRAFQYIQAPPDGIYDYGLVGTPPVANVPPVTAPVRITETWPLDSGLKGVRVHAQESRVTALIPR
jgi:hypothetical protein